MDEVAPESGPVEKTAGQTLRAARETACKSLEDIARQTRVPQRMLDALERDALHELPPGPYAVGFAKSFARALNLDANAIAAQVLGIQQQSGAVYTPTFVQYEPADTARIPSQALAWTAAGIALAMVIAYLVWKSLLMNPSPLANANPAPMAASSGSATSSAASAQPAAPAVAVPGNTPIRIAASAPVWFNLEDQNGRSQFDLTLQGGEFYTLKPEQRGLRLRTGRPQALRVLLGEDRLPQLGADDAIVSGIVMDTASLSQRMNATAVPAASTDLPAAPTAQR